MKELGFQKSFFGTSTLAVSTQGKLLVSQWQLLNNHSWGVYIRFVQAEEGGDLTKYQAEKKWNEMLKDPSVFKVEEDDKPKCAVLVHQDLVDYEDLSRTCQMNREQKLARMSEEQFNAKAECCISEPRMLWFLSKGLTLWLSTNHFFGAWQLNC